MVWGVISFPKPLFALEQYCLSHWGQQTHQQVLGADATTAKVTALSFLPAGSVLVILGLDLDGNVTWLVYKYTHIAKYF